jgi:AraC-like DNA-binding protein
VEKTLSSQTFRMAIVALEEMGIDARPILDELQISKLKLNNPLSRISINKELKFWNIVSKKIADPYLALHMAENVGFGTFALLEYIGASCESVYHVLSLLNKYEKIVYGAWRTKLTDSNGAIQFHLGTDGDPELYRYTNEFGLSVLYNRLKYFSGTNVSVRSVHFKHNGNETHEYERFFGAKVSFNQSNNILFFDSSIKSIRCKNSDSVLLGSLLKIANTMRGKPSEKESGNRNAFVEKVSAVVKQQLLYGDPRIEVVAKKLALSTRTLQRNLEAEGSTLKAIVAAVRKEMSSELLKEGKFSHEEIALLLGYSTLSAFNRAFRQWFRVTPSEYKRTN